MAAQSVRRFCRSCATVLRFTDGKCEVCASREPISHAQEIQDALNTMPIERAGHDVCT
jgi:hypothetical protein